MRSIVSAGKLGGRTRARTWNPLIKRQALGYREGRKADQGKGVENDWSRQYRTDSCQCRAERSAASDRVRWFTRAVPSGKTACARAKFSCDFGPTSKSFAARFNFGWFICNPFMLVRFRLCRFLRPSQTAPGASRTFGDLARIRCPRSAAVAAASTRSGIPVKTAA